MLVYRSSKTQMKVRKLRLDCEGEFAKFWAFISFNLDNNRVVLIPEMPFVRV